MNRNWLAISHNYWGRETCVHYFRRRFVIPPLSVRLKIAARVSNQEPRCQVSSRVVIKVKLNAIERLSCDWTPDDGSFEGKLISGSLIDRSGLNRFSMRRGAFTALRWQSGGRSSETSRSHGSRALNGYQQQMARWGWLRKEFDTTTSGDGFCDPSSTSRFRSFPSDSLIIFCRSIDKKKKRAKRFGDSNLITAISLHDSLIFQKKEEKCDSFECALIAVGHLSALKPETHKKPQSCRQLASLDNPNRGLVAASDPSIMPKPI